MSCNATMTRNATKTLQPLFWCREYVSYSPNISLSLILVTVSSIAASYRSNTSPPFATIPKSVSSTIAFVSTVNRRKSGSSDITEPPKHPSISLCASFRSPTSNSNAKYSRLPPFSSLRSRAGLEGGTIEKRKAMPFFCTSSIVLPMLLRNLPSTIAAFLRYMS